MNLVHEYVRSPHADFDLSFSLSPPIFFPLLFLIL